MLQAEDAGRASSLLCHRGLHCSQGSELNWLSAFAIPSS